ncbi:hypothetical protein NE865_13471 [Phthorimaea operculella]|nr:hypothetical protein NE865_13471 [Phthorimaea operculella]
MLMRFHIPKIWMLTSNIKILIAQFCFQLRSQESKKQIKQIERKRRKKKSSELTSHIIKKVRKGRRIIKISISNLEDSADNDEVMVQYIVNEQYDEILDSAENIVERIARKISRSDEL